MESFTFFAVCVFFLHFMYARAQDVSQQYIFIGVSGGLQDGFPDHIKMDYNAGQIDEVKAIFIGKALVRGCKAYLDVMQEGWRQYSPEPEQPSINSVVLVSGCHEHANEYWIYAADSRQVLTILNNEPRFLSITPDTGLVDLLANETSDAVKALARREIKRLGKLNHEQVAFPIVVAVWYHESFVPSPPISIHSDGTAITNFPESLALWANVNDTDRMAGCDNGYEECDASPQVVAAQKRYWDGIRIAIRNAEQHRLSETEWKKNGPPFNCIKQTRLGVGPETARINYAFTREQMAETFADAGYDLDFQKAVLR